MLNKLNPSLLLNKASFRIETKRFVIIFCGLSLPTVETGSYAEASAASG